MRQFGIDRLSIDDRIDLMHEIWDSLAAEPGMTHISAERLQELKPG